MSNGRPTRTSADADCSGRRYDRRNVARKEIEMRDALGWPRRSAAISKSRGLSHSMARPSCVIPTASRSALPLGDRKERLAFAS
jgi:hypothetical protein